MHNHRCNSRSSDVRNKQPFCRFCQINKAMFYIGFIGLALPGCGLSVFSDPKTNPVIEDHVNIERGLLATLATTPERRMVLVNTATGSPNYGKFCAEPPADVAESVAASFQAALTAAIANPTGQQAEVGGELGRSVASAVQALGQRSQGLTLYRDGSFHLCSMLLNGFIDTDTFIREWRILREFSVELIKMELTLNQGRVGSDPLPTLAAPSLEQLKIMLDDYFKGRGTILPRSSSDSVEQ